MTKYHYAAVRAETFIGAIRVPVPQDAYLSKEPETDALLALIDKGYRFVRIHDNMAIFEKQLTTINRETRELLDANGIHL